MKTRPRFLLAITSAILTFGILMATVGRPHFPHHFNHRQAMENCQSQFNKHQDTNEISPKQMEAKTNETIININDTITK